MTTPRQIVVATHGHCFDGMASAALFAHLARSLHGKTPLAMRHISCGYGPNMSQVPAHWLTGDENAILDFRYTPAKRLSWYFDHHATAFTSDQERATALAEAAPAGCDGPKVYHDAAYGSCTRLIRDVARRDYGVDADDLEELVGWAERIDTASFDSAADAIRRDEPVLQLASVVELHGDRAFLDAIVPMLEQRSVGEVARDPWVQELWAPLAAAHASLVERIRARSRRAGRVVVTDLSDAPLEMPAKFVSYALYPECMYSVTLSRSKQHYKIAVGYNPWCGSGRLHDIASICKRYGGGGHPMVGAATFRLGEEPRARAAAEEITSLLAA